MSSRRLLSDYWKPNKSSAAASTADVDVDDGNRNNDDDESESDNRVTVAQPNAFSFSLSTLGKVCPRSAASICVVAQTKNNFCSSPR